MMYDLIALYFQIQINHSALKLFTGLAVAAFIV